jgi:Na+/melibiose symporter-like transporter
MGEVGEADEKVGPSAAAALQGFFLTPFLLETVGLSPSTVGLMTFFAKAWDGLADPLVGYFSDRTESRWGRRKPWIAIGSIPLGVGTPAAHCSLPIVVDHSNLADGLAGGLVHSPAHGVLDTH